MDDEQYSKAMRRAVSSALRQAAERHYRGGDRVLAAYLRDRSRALERRK